MYSTLFFIAAPRSYECSFNTPTSSDSATGFSVDDDLSRESLDSLDRVEDALASTAASQSLQKCGGFGEGWEAGSSTGSFQPVGQSGHARQVASRQAVAHDRKLILQALSEMHNDRTELRIVGRQR